MIKAGKDDMRGLEGGTGGPDPEKIYDVVSRNDILMLK